MTIFDLIFIAVFLTSVVMTAAICVTAIRGRRRAALALLGSLGLFVAAYLTIIVIVSLTSPLRTLHLQQPQCFDDWCISVDQVERTPAGADSLYTVTLRLFSRARRRPQRENGVSVYVLDDRGRRYEPVEEPQAIPLNVLLNPGESIKAIRKFTLPADANRPGLVVTHSRFPGMLIIGDNQSLFHKPSVVLFE